ncbi:Saccharop dh and/or NAD binding 10 domain containing protein [Asbolus verrucosus]|uniref:Saccharop dh and/or NAD binding 10 domain containing protein n=1 Tax=Asbolus verrucosus TaxID=1661398 RepID=A0A482VUS7_ASBVE|nr:Saccharop dh and/or NAD binding 10 domain containing protein [Asbolus verrucosus]
MSNRLDIIVYGATGYTGKRVIQTLHEIVTKEKRHLTLGIAGRSSRKLQDLLRELEGDRGENYQQMPMVIADSKNEASLLEMASNARLVINCTGPYKFHGEPVVRACIRQSCHYIDVSAEPQFMERIQLLYNREAALGGVFVVSACGVDSIIADMGLDFLQKKFNGTLNSAECYMELLPEDGTFGTGPIMNYTTWESLLHVLSDYAQLKKIRTKLFKQLPNLEPKLSLKRLPHKVPMSENFAVPYPGIDATVMRRSQRYFYEKSQARPVQLHTYMATSKLWHVLLVSINFLLLVLLSKLRFCINLFLKNPKLFTLGMCSVGPHRKDTNNLQLITTLYGRGWKGEIVDESYKKPEDGWIVVKIKGRDPYEITAICATVSALVLLDQSQKLPETGGVYTPPPCFTGTNLVDLLQRNGLQFEMCAAGDLK